MPEMDVVRFNESDVIVASGDTRKTFNIQGLSDNTRYTMNITLGNGDYAGWSDLRSNSGSAFIGKLNDYLGGDYYTSPNLIDIRNSSRRWSDVQSVIMGDDWYSSGYEQWEGVYYWDPNTNKFIQ